MICWWCQYKRRYGLYISVRTFLSSRTIWVILRNILSSRVLGFNIYQMRELIFLDLSIALWPFCPPPKFFSVGLAIQPVPVNNINPQAILMLDKFKIALLLPLSGPFWDNGSFWEADGCYETSQFGKKIRGIYTQVHNIVHMVLEDSLTSWSLSMDFVKGHRLPFFKLWTKC